MTLRRPHSIGWATSKNLWIRLSRCRAPTLSHSQSIVFFNTVIVEPLSIGSVADQVTIEVLGAIGPPDRPPFAKPHLGGVHRSSSLGEVVRVSGGLRRFNGPSRIHQFVDQALSFLSTQGRVGGAPEASTNNEVAAIWGR